MIRLNILLVAPEHPDLPNVAAEVAALSNQHDVVRLTGIVRDVDVAKAVQEGPYDVLWFASHGNEQGVLLSDGLLSTQGVGQYARHANLCVLNTCSSENVALSIISGGETDMICTIADIKDADALRFGILLSSELAQTDNFYEAYERVRPDGGKYRYYKAVDSATRRIREDGGQREIHERLARIETTLNLELRQIREEIKRIEAQAMPLHTRAIVLAIGVIVGVAVGTLLQGIFV